MSYCVELQPGIKRCLFGDRWTFAIEVECSADEPCSSDLATVWFWVRGKVVGNTDAEEQIGILAGWLKWMISTQGHRPNSIFGDLDATTRLRLFLWWYSGTTDRAPVTGWVAPDGDPSPYFLSDPLAGPTLDSWQVMLTEDVDTVTLTWRSSDSTTVEEFSFPAQAFGGTLLAFLSWIRECPPTPDTPPGDAEP